MCLLVKSNRMNFSNISVEIAIVLLCIQTAYAHTFLTHPNAYNRVFQLRNCVGSECYQACPSVDESGMSNSADEPAAIWKRGEKVTINWARNNHRTGIIRFAIVPVKRKMDREAHRKLALYHGCFDQGEYQCKKDPELCGADIKGYGYRRNFTIPTIYPDGLYVFALVWYGGIHSPLSERRFFSDYWSCSHIRIEGGKSVGGTFRPFYDPGNNLQASKHHGMCLTGIDEPGVCPHSGCRGPYFHGLPKEYQDGKMPSPLKKSDIMEVMRWVERVPFSAAEMSH